MSALSESTADRIYDALVEHAGAPQRHRAHFIHTQTTEFCSEWRFMGHLGFGGKFWRNDGRLADGSWGECWYVNCYGEHETVDRLAVIEATNAALSEIRAEVMA